MCECHPLASKAKSQTWKSAAITVTDKAMASACLEGVETALCALNFNMESSRFRCHGPDAGPDAAWLERVVQLVQSSMHTEDMRVCATLGLLAAHKWCLQLCCNEIQWGPWAAFCLRKGCRKWTSHPDSGVIPEEESHLGTYYEHVTDLLLELKGALQTCHSWVKSLAPSPGVAPQEPTKELLEEQLLW